MYMWTDAYLYVSNKSKWFSTQKKKYMNTLIEDNGTLNDFKITRQNTDTTFLYFSNWGHFSKSGPL